jgi:hypothetical protein
MIAVSGISHFVRNDNEPRGYHADDRRDGSYPRDLHCALDNGLENVLEMC